MASHRARRKTHLGKVAVKDGLAVLKRVAALALAVLVDLVDADLVIPAGDGKEVLLALARRKGQCRDGVGGRIAQRHV